ncbi:hypothetical protein [Verrucomicrobium sp. BvORR106]|uniref:hypothetical protein n=1 Tax=Verrucomicrobium sp. BvORR106 TaxID=1403819 RepID=UPI000571ED1B|nr:hypothetical protein [Verrucomicrobium sp. BvORR106]
MNSSILDLELPTDSPNWDEPDVDLAALNEWRMQATIWEREHGEERARETPNVEPFIWAD